MAGGFDDLLEELRLASDEIVVFPRWLMGEAMGRGPFDHIRQLDRVDMRLPALRALADVREIAKVLKAAPGFGTGDLEIFATRFENSNDRSAEQLLQGFLGSTGQGLADVVFVIKHTIFALAPEAVRATDALRQAEALYCRLAENSADAIMTSCILPEVADHAERVGEAGRNLIEEVDQNRRLLDNAIGTGQPTHHFF